MLCIVSAVSCRVQEPRGIGGAAIDDASSVVGGTGPRCGKAVRIGGGTGRGVAPDTVPRLGFPSADTVRDLLILTVDQGLCLPRARPALTSPPTQSDRYTVNQPRLASGTTLLAYKTVPLSRC